MNKIKNWTDDAPEELKKHWFIPSYSGNKKSKDGKTFRAIHFNFEDGQGISNNQYSALVRPFWKILVDGKPVNPVTFVEHRENNEYFVLGAFTCTGKRLLFFPGMNLALASPTPELLVKGKLDFFPAHFTLEDDLVSWHMSDLLKKFSKNKLDKLQAHKITNDLKCWFRWAVTPGVLEKLPACQNIQVWGNESELQRRSNNIDNAVTPERLKVTQIDEDVKGSYYWQFEFFVHKKQVESDPSVREYPLHPVYYAYTPQIVKEDREFAQPQIVTVKIPGFFGTVFIRYTKLKGSFPSDCLIGSCHEIPDS